MEDSQKSFPLPRNSDNRKDRHFHTGQPHPRCDNAGRYGIVPRPFRANQNQVRSPVDPGAPEDADERSNNDDWVESTRGAPRRKIESTASHLFGCFSHKTAPWHSWRTFSIGVNPVGPGVLLAQENLRAIPPSHLQRQTAKTLVSRSEARNAYRIAARISRVFRYLAAVSSGTRKWRGSPPPNDSGHIDKALHSRLAVREKLIHRGAGAPRDE